MRSFFSGVVAPDPVVEGSEDRSAHASSLFARVALYDAPASAPRVVDVRADDPREFIERLATTVYEFAREAGGSLPYSAIRELTENYIHAGFTEPVVSVLDQGTTIRFADQGPGIPDKLRATQPGFTTATAEHKSVIRGVGSGLPIVKEFLGVSGGTLKIEDNLGGGSVITMTLDSGAGQIAPRASQAVAPLFAEESSLLTPSSAADRPGSVVRLSARQKRVLALVLDSGSAGPSLVARELGIGLSTAHRDLAFFESLGLMGADESGKRSLTPAGAAAAEDLLR